MIETPLNKVLNTMRQYVENIYEHDSEPMLNWKDIKLVLDEIERLNKEKSILEKSLKLIWEKDIEIDYEELDNANKVLEEALKEGK